MIRYRSFEVRYLPATNFKPSRIKILDTFYLKSVILSLDYDFNSINEQAIDFLKQYDIEIVAKSTTRKNDSDQSTFLLTTNFDQQIRE